MLASVLKPLSRAEVRRGCGRLARCKWQASLHLRKSRPADMLDGQACPRWQGLQPHLHTALARPLLAHEHQALRSVATSAFALASPGAASQCRHALTARNATCKHGTLSGRAWRAGGLHHQESWRCQNSRHIGLHTIAQHTRRKCTSSWRVTKTLLPSHISA